MKTKIEIECFVEIYEMNLSFKHTKETADSDMAFDIIQSDHKQ